MAIDAGIYRDIQPIKIESPINQLGQLAQLQQAQNQNRQFDMAVEDRDRARQSDAAVRSAYTLDDPSARSAALRQADPKAYRDDLTFQATQAKTQREADKAKTEHVKAMVDLQGQLLGSVKDQSSWDQALQVAQQSGMDTSKFPSQYDPAFVQSARARSMTESQRLEQEWKQKGYDLDVSKFGYQQKNDAANRNVTMRGQNMTDSRARDLAAATREAGGAGKAPSGYRFNPDGSLSAIPGGPADPSVGTSAKPTADYLKQAEAYQNMDDAITGYKGVLSNFGMMDAANPAKRTELSTSYQNALLQAKEIYKLGVLNGGDERIIKGVINNPLDLTSVVVPKAALLKQATDLQGIIKRGNENLAKVNKQKVVPLNSESAQPVGEPKAGTVVDGYRFKGGNPADKNAWEKQ